MQNDNLWHKFNDVPTISALQILKKQGDYLLEMTYDLVYGDVENITTEKMDGSYQSYEFSHRFVLKSKIRDDYKYELLSIHYDISLYPMTIKIDKDVSTEIAKSLHGYENGIIGLNEDADENQAFDIKNMARFDIEDSVRFVYLLEKIFSTKKVENVIVSLMNLSM